MAELKPCPICKKEPKGFLFHRYNELTLETEYRFKYHCCGFSSGLCESEEEAAEAWNRRTEPPKGE